jgi:hypothetical protein
VASGVRMCDGSSRRRGGARGRCAASPSVDGDGRVHRRRCVVVAAGRSVRHNRMSHVEAQHRGWRRIDPRPWTKLAAQWWHAVGWRLAHCGHPTALWLWRLYAPDGAMHCSGGPARPPRAGGGLGLVAEGDGLRGRGPGPRRQGVSGAAASAAFTEAQPGAARTRLRGVAPGSARRPAPAGTAARGTSPP